MPRRNHRDGLTGPPLDLTPAEVRRNPVPVISDPQKARRARADRAQEAAERQRLARINNGIDWSVCLVPGCGGELPTRLPGERVHDSSMALPLCYSHLGIAYVQANRRANEALMVKATTAYLEHKEAAEKARAKTDREAWLSRSAGHIYFVRLNGLVKVGWSRDVHERLRAYGPDVEVLCIYPGSRDDETNLHRQLTPVRARGREWYEDGKIIADYVSQILERHGPPTVYDQWTRPAQIIKPRKRAS